MSCLIFKPPPSSSCPRAFSSYDLSYWNIHTPFWPPKVILYIQIKNKCQAFHESSKSLYVVTRCQMSSLNVPLCYPLYVQSISKFCKFFFYYFLIYLKSIHLFSFPLPERSKLWSSFSSSALIGSTIIWHTLLVHFPHSNVPDFKKRKRN